MLIRYAYFHHPAQRKGMGGELLSALVRTSEKPILIGTWKAAAWAIGFYEKHGFAVVPGEDARVLLEEFWSIPVRQMETSVVLAYQRVPSEAR